jgi:acyl-CoA synthetase (AMP-forming)/AMP-acid ligase II
LKGASRHPAPPLTPEGFFASARGTVSTSPCAGRSANRDVLSLGAGRSFTYREADVRVDALARFFVALGLAPGDCIAAQLPNSAEQPLTMLAAWRAGLTVVMLPALWRRMEIAKVCAELKPRAGRRASRSPSRLG